MKFLGRVNGGQVFKPHGFGVIGERQPIDLVHFAQLRAGAPMRGLERAGDQRAFAQEVLFDGVRRDEDVGRFGLKMVVRGAEESEPFFRDFQISGTVFRCAIRLGAHRSNCVVSERPSQRLAIESHMNIEFRENLCTETEPGAGGFRPVTTD